MFRFRPLQDYSIIEPARLIISDNRASTIILKEELRVCEEFCLSFEGLEEHLDYKFNIQTKSEER